MTGVLGEPLQMLACAIDQSSPEWPKVYCHSQDNLAGGRELENKTWKKNTDIADLPTAL